MFRNGLLFKRSVFFDAPADNGGSTTPPPAAPPAGNAPATQPPAGNPPADVTFTPEQQAKVNEIIKERLGRHKTETTDELLKALGVKDTAEAKKFVDDARKAELDRLSEIDKANKVAEDATKAAEASELKAQQAMDRALKAEVKIAAQAANFRPEAYDDVFLLVDRTLITEKDGVFEGLDAAVAKVAELKPYWLVPTDGKNQTPPGSPQNPKTVVQAKQPITTSPTGTSEVVVEQPLRL